VLHNQRWPTQLSDSLLWGRYFFLRFPPEVASLAVVLDIWQADDASVKDVLSEMFQKAQDASIAIAHRIV
jgi:hypothetical protein